VFGVTARGAIQEHEIGFHAIGAGGALALAALYPTPLFRFQPSVPRIVYNLCAAKFAAESASGVGRTTTVLVIPRDDRGSVLFSDDVDQIRRIWTKRGKPPVPKAAETLVEQKLMKPPWWWAGGTPG
jgi:hypothetical protein